MTVYLYAIAKRINSTKRPSGSGRSFSVTLKDTSSVMNPKIAFKWDPAGSNFHPSAYNYAYIADYQRWYWINEWTFDERQWIASMSVDVLASYKDSIESASKYVLRADVDDMTQPLIDNKYPLKVGKTSSLPGTLTGWTDWTTELSQGSVVVAAIGTGNTYGAGGISYFYVTPSQFTAMVTACFTESLFVWSSTQTLGQNLGEVFQRFGENWLKSLNDPFRYIRGAMWFPFQFPHSSSGGDIWLGQLNTHATGYPITNGSALFSGAGTLSYQADQTLPIYHKYRMIQPCYTANLHFMPFGIIPIDTSVTLPFGGEFTVDVKVDAVSGIGRLDLFAGHNRWHHMFSTSAQVGVPLAIADMAVDYLNALRTTANAIGTTATVMSAPTAEGVLGAAAAIGSALSSYMPQTAVIGSSGGMAGLEAAPHWYSQALAPVEENSVEFGRPVCETRTLGDISGFIQCADPEISIATAFPDEIRQLGDYLTGGFFHE